MSSSNPKMGIMLVLTASLADSLTAAAAHWATNFSFETAELIFYRGVCTAVIAAFLCWNVYSHSANLPQQNNIITRCTPSTKKHYGCMLAMSICSAFSSFLYYESISLLAVGDAVTLHNFASVLTPIAAYFVFGDSVTMRHIVALLLAMLACILISQPSFLFADQSDTSDSPAHAYVIAMISCVFQSSVYIIIELSGDLASEFLLFSSGLGFVVVICIMSLAQVTSLQLHLFDMTGWGQWLCIFVFVAMGVTTELTMILGGHRINAGLLSLLMASAMAWSFLWGVLWFQEEPDALSCVGAAMMFCSVFVVSYKGLMERDEHGDEYEHVDEYDDRDDSA